MLWQHVFQAVVCLLSAVFLLINFSKAQRKLPEDGPDGPKHVGANVRIFKL